MKITKAEARRRALAAWWARGPWPCVLLAVDPGEAAGASLGVSRPTGLRLKWSTPVDTYARGTVEAVVERAVEDAEAEGLPLVAMLEDWGAGGPRGLAQWIGLGEARGIWRRWLNIHARESDALALSRITKVVQSRWRSRVIEATGVPEGKVDPDSGVLMWRAFTAAEWKVEARRAAMDYFLDTHVPVQEDAAESACMLIYGARSDEVMKALAPGHLKRHGLGVPEALEETIRGSKRARRAG